MTDFKVLVDTFMKGTPWAVLIAAIGTFWQLMYIYSRDRIRDKQVSSEKALEEKKFQNQQSLDKQRFDYQQSLESMKFEYEQRRWREQLSLQIALKHVDSRLEEYIKAWSYIEAIAKNRMDSGNLSPEVTKEVASSIKGWRYSKGGLLAEENTRDAAYAFQKALWEYDGTKEGYRRIRSARRLFRYALRADMGIGKDMSGLSIFDVVQKRQSIDRELFFKELRELKDNLGISSDTESSL